ncbi:MAG TPA: hypothetical protein VFT42_07180 [Solirubrobacteraceae bacterium]|nr:hypothetical protein [Solirubrobacteraceae bacterium]
MERPLGIYASSASRRDRVWGRPRRRRTLFAVRAGAWTALAAVGVLAAAVAERLIG